MPVNGYDTIASGGILPFVQGRSLPFIQGGPCGSSASLLYSTFLGGSADDKAMGLALGGVDVVYGRGCASVTGKTKSSNFPVAGRGYANAYGRGYALASYAGGSGYDAYVLQLDLGSNSLVYGRGYVSTYLVGTGNDEGLVIAVGIVGEPASPAVDPPPHTALRDVNPSHFTPDLLNLGIRYQAT